MEAAVTPNARIPLFCHPHHPLVRAWERATHAEVVALHRRHARRPLLRQDPPRPSARPGCPPTVGRRPRRCGRPAGHAHIPEQDYRLTGLSFAFASVQDRERLNRFRRGSGGPLPNPGCFAAVAAEAASRQAETWLTRLLEHLRGNRDVERFVADSLLGAEMAHVEATHLTWLDVSRLRHLAPTEARLGPAIALSSESTLGDQAFPRLDVVGCPRELLREGLRRLTRGLS